MLILLTIHTAHSPFPPNPNPSWLMTMILINMRQSKAHYNKVIGSEIIIRQVTELGVKMKLERGREMVPAVPALFWQEWNRECENSAVRTLCSEDTLQRHTPNQLMKPGAG